MPPISDTTTLKALKLLDKATAPKSSDPVKLTGKNANRTYQATLYGPAVCTADVQIEVSNDGENWMVLGHIILSNVDELTDGFVDNAAWLYTRATLASITGTQAAVDVLMAY